MRENYKKDLIQIIKKHCDKEKLKKYESILDKIPEEDIKKIHKALFHQLGYNLLNWEK